MAKTHSDAALARVRPFGSKTQTRYELSVDSQIVLRSNDIDVCTGFAMDAAISMIDAKIILMDNNARIGYPNVFKWDHVYSLWIEMKWKKKTKKQEMNKRGNTPSGLPRASRKRSERS